MRIIGLRATVTDEIIRQIQEKVPEVEIETGYMEPQTPVEVLIKAQDFDADFVLLLGVRPIIMDAKDAGVRFIFMDEHGDLVELDDITVSTKPFVP